MGRGAIGSWGMTVTLCTKRFRTLDQIRAFLEGSDPLEMRPADSLVQ